MQNPQETNESAMMRQGDVVEALQVSRTTLIEMEKRGDITPVKLPSGHRRYRRSDVEALLSPSTPMASAADLSPRTSAVGASSVSGDAA